MNLRQARQELLINAKAGNATLFISDSGIGKTSMAYQVFEHLRDEGARKNERWGFFTFMAAHMQVPDLMGYLFKGEKVYDMPDGTKKTVTVTDPSVPTWMISVDGIPAFLYDKCFLVIDEYGQGEPDLKRSVAELLLHGRIGPWMLPEGSVRAACSNEGVRYGVTKDFDHCYARRVQLYIKGDTQVWLEDFADKPYWYQGREWLTSGMTKAWAATHTEELFGTPPEKKQGPWCNPRTLCSFDRNLQAREEVTGAKINPDDPALLEVGEGTIGMPATRSYISTLQYRIHLPSYEEVIANPTGALVPAKPDQRMLMAYELAGWARVEHLAQCITYMQRLPQDMAITFVSSLLRRDYNGLINQPPLAAWISKNAAMLTLVGSLSR